MSTGLGEIYEFYLESDRHSPMELRTLLDWVVAYRLRSVPGVIEVNTMGGEVKQYQVVLDPRKMAGFKLTLREVLTALQQNNTNVGGGYIETNNEQVVIRGEAQFKDAEDIADTVLAVDGDGTPTLLRRIAEVKVGPALRYGVVTMHGKGEIVAGTVMMLIGANSREVVKNVKLKIEEIQADLPAGVKIVPYYDRADFIERMLTTVGVNLAEGAALVIAVLFLMLGSLRGSLLAALAIPLSMGVAVIGMRQFGVTGNLMSLGAIDFGLLVDGAIVMLEGTLHALDKQRPPPDEVPAAVARGDGARGEAGRVRGRHHHAGLPAADGAGGRRGEDVPADGDHRRDGAGRRAAVHAHHVSGGVRLRAAGAQAEHARAPRADGAADGGVTPCCSAGRCAARRWCSRSRGWRWGSPFHSAARWAPSSCRGWRRGSSRSTCAGCRRSASRRPRTCRSRSSRWWRVFPEALSVVTRLGRAEVATDPVGVDESQVRIKLKPPKRVDHGERHGRRWAQIMKNAIEQEVPATYVAISQPIEDRVNQLLSGSRADLAIKVFGPDLETLRGIGNQIAAILKNVPGHRRPARAARAGAAAAGRPRRSPAPGAERDPRRRGAGDGGGGARGDLRGQGLRGHAAIRRHAAAAAAAR